MPIKGINGLHLNVKLRLNIEKREFKNGIKTGIRNKGKKRIKE